MTPYDKALLLQAVAEMTKANLSNVGSGWGCFNSVRDNCRDVANLILESIKNDFKEDKQNEK